jgi:GINS complex subunit 2
MAISSFLAGDEPVSIIPSFHHPEPLGLISGQVGPFRAGMDTVVPLWLAVMLRRRKLAKIIPPSWMDTEVLKEALRFERDPREASFSSLLPFRHAEIAQAILSACRSGSGTGASSGGSAGDSEIPDADRIKLLLEDIATVRMDKIRRSVHTLSSQILSAESRVQPIIDVTNIGSVEMHSVKLFMTESFRNHREFSGKGSAFAQSAQSAEGSRSDSAGNGAETSGRGRLRASRLVRESEELETPRPLEEIEAEEEEESGDEVENSRLRRFR